MEIDLHFSTDARYFDHTCILQSKVWIEKIESDKLLALGNIGYFLSKTVDLRGDDEEEFP